MPLSCAAPSARAICAAIRTARSSGNGAPWRIACDERLAVDVLHHRVGHAVGRRAEVGDVDDVRVADARRRLRLLHEARIVAASRMTSRLSTLIASGRSITAWRAANTTPMPPSPILRCDVVAAVERLADEPVVLAAAVASICANALVMSPVCADTARTARRRAGRPAAPTAASRCGAGTLPRPRRRARSDCSIVIGRAAGHLRSSPTGSSGCRRIASGLPSNGQNPGSRTSAYKSGHWSGLTRHAGVVQRSAVVGEQLVVRGHDEDRRVVELHHRDRAAELLVRSGCASLSCSAIVAPSVPVAGSSSRTSTVPAATAAPPSLGDAEFVGKPSARYVLSPSAPTAKPRTPSAASGLPVTCVPVVPVDHDDLALVTLRRIAVAGEHREVIADDRHLGRDRHEAGIDLGDVAPADLDGGLDRDGGAEAPDGGVGAEHGRAGRTRRACRSRSTPRASSAAPTIGADVIASAASALPSRSTMLHEVVVFDAICRRCRLFVVGCR